MSLKDKVLALTINRNTLKVIVVGNEIHEFFSKDLLAADFQSFLNATILETSVSQGKFGLSFDLAFYHSSSCEVVYRRVRPLPLKLIYSITRQYRENSELLKLNVLNQKLLEAYNEGFISSFERPKERLFEMLFNYDQVGLIEALFKTEDEKEIARSELLKRIDAFQQSYDNVMMKYEVSKSCTDFKDLEQQALALAVLNKRFKANQVDYRKNALFLRVLHWLAVNDVIQYFSDLIWHFKKADDSLSEVQAEYQERMKVWDLVLPTHKLMIFHLSHINERPNLNHLKHLVQVCIETEFLQVVQYSLQDLVFILQKCDPPIINKLMAFKNYFNVSDVAYCCALGYWQIDHLYNAKESSELDHKSKEAL